MAAKKISEFVKGKIIQNNHSQNQNIGIIHFNQVDDDNENNQSINITNYGKLFENEIIIDYDESINNKIIDEELFEGEVSITTSPKSSPGTKLEWSTHVKKNLNTAMEDAYSSLSSLMKSGVGQTEGGGSVCVSKGVVGTTGEGGGSVCVSKGVVGTTGEGGSACVSEGVMGTKTEGEGEEEVGDCGGLCEVSSRGDKVAVEAVGAGGDPCKSLSSSSSYSIFVANDNNDDCEINKRRNYIHLPKNVRKSLIDNYQFKSSSSTSSLRHNINYYTRWKVVIVLLSILTILFIVSLKTLIGFILGAGSCYLLLIYYGVINLKSQKDILMLPKLKDLKSPVIPHIQENNDDDRDLFSSQQSNYSCWINMLGIYDTNTYNINQCQVVHLDIEEKLLRIRRTKKKITHRALWKDGNYHGLTFTSEILVDIKEVKIGLQPAGLVKKRLWSKKYPICISFPKVLSECVSDNSFADILNYNGQEIYFFGRTCRDKEELFRRLLNASNSDFVDFNMWNIVQQYLTRPSEPVESIKPFVSSKSAENLSRKLSMHDETEDYKKVTYRNINKEEDEEPCIEAFRRKSDHSIPQIAEYVKYMAKFMPCDMFLLTSKVMQLDISYVTCTPELLCINAFLGRIFWDFLRGSHWVDIISNKIQCKLQKIHLPQFMDELTVMDIHLGKEIPLIRKFSRPYLDSRGLWFDADIAYTGGFSMILETKVNLFNLRNQIKRTQFDDDKKFSDSIILNNGLSEESSDRDLDNSRSRSQSKVVLSDKTAAFVSSEEDSAESSSYSEDSGDENKLGATGPPTTSTAGGSSKRLIRWVDKIARSPYFIKAADNKYIQRGMEMVSNTKLMLQVELHSVSGTLAINIPPPPSDRVWYGFRPSPILKLSAKPKVGQKEISISKITDLIEKKLIVEFQRVLVLPNMEDVPLPLLVNGNITDYMSHFQ